MIYQFNLSFSLSLLLMGFLLANIFGILTNNKNIIFFFVLCIEIINYLVYHNFFAFAKGISSMKLLGVQQRGTTFMTFLSRPLTMTEGLSFEALVVSKDKKDFKGFENNKQQDGPQSLLEPTKNLLGKNISIFVSILITTLNFLKVGFEFGFFIDAFKLGS